MSGKSEQALMIVKRQIRGGKISVRVWSDVRHTQITAQCSLDGSKTIWGWIPLGPCKVVKPDKTCYFTQMGQI